MRKDATLSAQVLNVLFPCTGNSARSILGEAILDPLAMNKDRFRAHGAGSHPAGQVKPPAIELLERHPLPTEALRSKAWHALARPDVPHRDFGLTVCDNAANEVCPVWPGQPMTAHWGVADPAAVEGGDETRRHAFFVAFSPLSHRISLFASLPLDKLDQIRLPSALDDIGRS